MRITGVLLTIGTTGVAGMALVGGVDAPGNCASAIASSSVAPLAKFSVGFSLVYHYIGAVRHVVWDKTAKGFTNAQMLQSSYAVAGAALAISLHSGIWLHSKDKPAEFVEISEQVDSSIYVSDIDDSDKA